MDVGGARAIGSLANAALLWLLADKSLIHAEGPQQVWRQMGGAGVRRRCWKGIFSLPSSYQSQHHSWRGRGGCQDGDADPLPWPPGLRTGRERGEPRAATARLMVARGFVEWEETHTGSQRGAPLGNGPCGHVWGSLMAPRPALALSFLCIKCRAMQTLGTLVYLDIHGTFCRSRAY